MRRLPRFDELQDTADEVSRELSKVDAYDLERFIATVEVAVWEAEQAALTDLTTGEPPYHAGGLNALRKLQAGLEAALASKQNS